VLVSRRDDKEEEINDNIEKESLTSSHTKVPVAEMENHKQSPELEVHMHTWKFCTSTSSVCTLSSVSVCRESIADTVTSTSFSSSYNAATKCNRSLFSLSLSICNIS
jgi:hypothetical protein